MTAYCEIHINKELFLLLPQKAIYRPKYKQLILADVHLGKATHFRRHGIPMPIQSHLKDIDLIHYLVDRWEPEMVMILGDLFHSSYNNEWRWFQAILKTYPNVQFVLVEGNHDILPESNYEIENLSKVPYVEEAELIFSHHPIIAPRKFNICGHLHPGLQVHGTARQSVKLPCFYKNDHHLILPAFGQLTGLHLLERELASEYYLVMSDKVVKL